MKNEKIVKKQPKVGEALGHGDVILIRVDDQEIPPAAKKKEKPVLAYGEVSGHSHAMTQGDCVLYEYNDATYLKIQSEIGVLQHEEHDGYELPSGTYEVRIQRSYKPEGWQKVVD